MRLVRSNGLVPCALPTPFDSPGQALVLALPTAASFFRSFSACRVQQRHPEPLLKHSSLSIWFTFPAVFCRTLHATIEYILFLSHFCFSARLMVKDGY